jgi:hypothetical protein
MSDEPVEQTPMRPSGKSLLCLLGLHLYEKEPGLLYYVRNTGLNILFFTSGEQVGIKRCKCCGKQKFVCRSGFVGIGGSANKWKRCSKQEADRINAGARL